MKTQRMNNSGLMNLVAGLTLAVSGANALAYTDVQSFDTVASLGSDLAVFHAPVAGTVLSASLIIGADGVSPGPLGDEIGVVRIASLLSPEDYHFLGFLTPTSQGEYAESLFVLSDPLLPFLNTGMIVSVLVDGADNKNADVSFRLYDSVLTADVIPHNPNPHSTPDGGSTLLLLGAGLTLLGALRGRLS